MKFINLTVIASLVLLSSCGSRLSVQVDAFDMAKMREGKEYQSESRRAELIKYQTLLQSGIFEKAEKQILSEVRTFLTAFARNKRLDSTRIEPTMKIVTPKLHQKITNYKAATSTISNALESLIASNDKAVQNTYSNAFISFSVAKTEFELFTRELAAEILKPELEAQALSNNINNLTSVVALKYTFGNSIAADNMASFVAKAPEQYWLKYESTFYTNDSNLSKSIDKASINVTKIKTIIGNSDIAVKMDGPGNFLIKGVRLDADEAFKTSFKVLSQGIKYLTYTAGIPTPAKDASPVVKIPEVESYDRNKSQSEALTTQYQQLTDSFLKIIDSYKADLVSTSPTKRKRAVIAVKDAYTYYRSQLPITQPQQP